MTSRKNSYGLDKRDCTALIGNMTKTRELARDCEFVQNVFCREADWLIHMGVQDAH